MLLDTTGLVEAPLIAMHTFLAQTIQGTGDIVLQRLSTRLDADHTLPLSQVLLQSQTCPNDGVCITPELILRRLLGDLPNGADPDNLAARIGVPEGRSDGNLRES